MSTLADIKTPIVSKKIILPFVLVTSCFALWGFANDITNPMVEAFSRIFKMGVSGGTWVQVAFYGGYGVMAIPAAIFIRKYTYKAGILMGLGLYATGALLFIPATAIGNYFPFLAAYFIMTCGLSFLETSANPYILSMGNEETATRRLNLAQAFNPIGSLSGMFVAMIFIQANIDPRGADERSKLSPEAFESLKKSDLEILSSPYIAIGLVILAMFLVIALVKMPKSKDPGNKLGFIATIAKLLRIERYREGVISQMFYVGAQIMCWTFIIQYGINVFTNRGMTAAEAAELSQMYNIVAMGIFLVSRFICTFLLKYICPGKLLMFLAIGGILLSAGTVFFQGITGLYCLVGISACMSLMFPTIYGISLKGISHEDAKIGAAGLIMAIVGGTFLPKLQSYIIDLGVVFNMPAVNVSFLVPLMCFAIITVFGYRTSVNKEMV